MSGHLGHQRVISGDLRGFTTRPQPGEWTWGRGLIDHRLVQTRAAVSGILAAQVGGRRLSDPIMTGPVAQQAHLRAGNTEPGHGLGHAVAVLGDPVSGLVSKIDFL